jgi:hypothetical protein
VRIRLHNIPNRASNNRDQTLFPTAVLRRGRRAVAERGNIKKNCLGSKKDKWVARSVTPLPAGSAGCGPISCEKHNQYGRDGI